MHWGGLGKAGRAGKDLSASAASQALELRQCQGDRDEAHEHRASGLGHHVGLAAPRVLLHQDDGQDGGPEDDSRYLLGLLAIQTDMTTIVPDDYSHLEPGLLASLGPLGLCT